MRALNSVDIIVPIYNAYDELTKCIDSIYQKTDLNFHRLILINDNSSDPRILPYLASIEGENIIVITNETNRGFSANVNLGMQQSDHDVILLNSDTIVTDDWINKIFNCAYSDEQIATVTPLSNSATLASVPTFGIDNHLPTNITIDQMAEIIERCSLKEYPRIPVAVGFCMFIKRKVLDEIGGFDEKTFGRGYGEENDFCYRAELYGYKHVLCDDTFIYHKGTGSFRNDEKEKLISEHIRILEERYSVFMRETHLYCIENPHHYIRDNINIYINLENGKRNLLYILHADFNIGATNNIGGTQFHVRDLYEFFKEEYNVFVLTPAKDALHLFAYINGQEYQFDFPLKEQNVMQVFNNIIYEHIYETVISAFKINLVHIHHLQGHSLDIFTVASKCGIPIILTIHDFYLICPTIFMYSSKNFLCTYGKQGDCKECLSQKLHISPTVNYIKYWRSKISNILPLVDTLVFPSKSAESIFTEYYPDVKNKAIIISHGLTLNNATTIIPNFNTAQESNDVKFNIEKTRINEISENEISGWAFLSNCNNQLLNTFIEITDSQAHKHVFKSFKTIRPDVDDCFEGNGKYLNSGFQTHIMKNEIPDGLLTIKIIIQKETQYFKTPIVTTVDYKTFQLDRKFNIAFIGGISYVKGSDIAYQMITQNNDINWFVFGNIDPNEPLASLTKENFFNMGAYYQSDIVSLLHKNDINLICILSKCAETFCYTLSEAMLAQIPVIGLDVGAVGERIKECVCGWTVPVDISALALLQKIYEIRDSKEYIEHVEKSKNWDVKSKDSMNKEYNVLYKHLQAETITFDFDKKLVYKCLKGTKGKEALYE